MNLTKEQEVFAKVVLKCWEDGEFKQKLVANPSAMIEELTGSEFHVPDGKTLVVRDQSDTSKLYINIPSLLDEAELTDAELEIIAGGGYFYDQGVNLAKWVKSWGDPCEFWS